jgi:membrane-associated phospholipid phosphatase
MSGQARRGATARLAPLVLAILSFVLLASSRPVYAAPVTPDGAPDAPSSLRIVLRTSQTATKTGDHVTVDVTVTNASSRRVRDVTVFLGLVDLHPGQRMPLGPETWTNDPESLALPSLEPGASASAAWHLLMIQPGPLGVYASALFGVGPHVDSSGLTQLTVRDARVVNPGHVLPLAVGEPLVLAAVLAAVAHMRSPGRRRPTLTPGTTRGWKMIVIAAAIVFLALALTARFGGVSAVEREAYVAVLDTTTETANIPFRLLNHLGDAWGLVPVGLVVVAAFPSDVCARWWLWLGTMLGAGTLEILGKSIIGRPRPLGHAPGFPSGHVTAGAAFFVMVGYLVANAIPSRTGRTAVWAVATLCIALVATARIALHAHWPLDVLGGAALGIGCGGAAAWWNEAHLRDRAGAA